MVFRNLFHQAKNIGSSFGCGYGVHTLRLSKIGVYPIKLPLYGKESKTLTARVYYNNSKLKIPVGSQVKATVTGNTKEAYWLPKEAVLSLGLDKVVFEKIDGGFKASKINTGIT